MTQLAYQKDRQFIAQIADGLEELGKEELEKLGATQVQTGYRSLTFTADETALWKVVYCSRLINRVLAPLVRFSCKNEKQLYGRVRELPWEELFGNDQTFAVFANLSDSTITHSQYASLTIKDGVVDRFRDSYGKRPSIDTRNPDCWIHLHLRHNKATLSLDVSGGAMHRRGYRQPGFQAPMLETVAAAVISMSEWDSSKPFIDPLCGSGTLLAEALMAGCHIPSGYLRKRFGFELLPEFDEKMWDSLKQELDQAIVPGAAGQIRGSDIDPRAVKYAEQSLKNLPGGSQVELVTSDFRDLGTIKDSVIVCNPPYGMRMKKEDIGQWYKEFGDFLKFSCASSTAYIYFGDRAMLKKIGLRSSWKKVLKSGGLDGRLAKFELY